MEPNDETNHFLRLLEQAIPDRQRDKAEILHLARQLVGANEYVQEMSDPIVLRAMHLYHRCSPKHGNAHVPLPALIHFLRARRGLQQIDVLERRLLKIRQVLCSWGLIDLLQPVHVNPWDVLSLRVLAGIVPPKEERLSEKEMPDGADSLSSKAIGDTA